MATKPKKATLTWIDIKGKLAGFDRAGLLGLVQDLYAASKDNRTFLHTRLGLGDDVLEPYKEIIDRWISPNAYKLQDTSVAKARKAIADYRKASGRPEGLAELMVFFCERAAVFSSEYGNDDEAYYDGVVTVFEQALKVSATLPAEQRDAMFNRLDDVRRISHDLGYGVGDDMNDLVGKYWTIISGEAEVIGALRTSIATASWHLDQGIGKHIDTCVVPLRARHWANGPQSGAAVR